MSAQAHPDDELLSLKHLFGLLWRHGQNLLVYPAAFDMLERRRPPEIRTPAMVGIPYVAPLLRTPDGVDLSCYLLPQTRESLADGYHIPSRAVEDSKVDVTPAAAEARATVVVFHGNSAHHWEDMITARDLFAMKCNVLLLSYRGYSLSGGSPNEKGLRIDAQTGLDYILNQPHLSNVPIIVYGHSLGGGVAIDLASRNPTKVSGIIVSNTFTSIPDIVRRWPFIGVFSFICHQKWRSADKMHLIPTTTPILMLSGRSDEVIPPELMDKLWVAAQKRGGKKRKMFRGSCVSAKEAPEVELKPGSDVFVPIAAATHNNTPDMPEYWAAIEEFVHRWTKRTPSLNSSPPTAQIRPDTRWRYIGRNLVVVN